MSILHTLRTKMLLSQESDPLGTFSSSSCGGLWTDVLLEVGIGLWDATAPGHCEQPGHVFDVPFLSDCSPPPSWQFTINSPSNQSTKETISFLSLSKEAFQCQFLYSVDKRNPD